MSDNLERNDLKIYFGGAIKATANGIIEGRGVTYTSAQQRDLHHEFFDATTDHAEDDYKFTDARILYNHGLDSKMSIRNIGKPIKAQKDDAGIWLQAQLDMADEYEQMIYEMAEAGKLHWSSGALPQSVIVDDNGHIKRWAIIEFSLTPTPAMPVTNRITTVKSLTQPNQQTDSPTGRKGDNGHKGDTDASADSEPAQANVQHVVKTSTPKTGAKMNIKTLKNRYRQTVRQELDAMVEQELASIVEQIAAEVGADVAPDDAVAIAEAVTTDIENAVEATSDEDAMMMVDDENKALEDEEQRKAARGIVQKHFYSVAYKQAYLRFGNKKAELEKVKADAQAKARMEYQKAQPATSTLPAFSGHGNTRVSVGENLKYAHLSADEMAAGYLLIESQFPKPQRGRIAANMVVSDEYLRHMVNKALQSVKSADKFADIRDYQALKAAIPYKTDDFDATSISGQGQDWVGTLYGTRLWEKARNETKVFSELSSRGMFMQEIPQGSASVVIPTEGADPIAYSTPQATDLDATNRPEVTANIGFIGTGSVTLSAAQVKIAAATTDELVEDSVIAVLPQMTQQLQIKGVETLEQACINGDTVTTGSANINLIDGTPGTGIDRPYYLAVNGLRKYPLVTNTNYARSAGGSLVIDDFRLTLKLMTSAVRDRLDQLFFLIDSDTHNTALALPEVQTDDVRRTNATITSGRLLNIFGVDVLTTGFMPLGNSAGKVPGAGGTLGQMLLVYAPFWAFGWKRNVRIDTEYSPVSGTTTAVASMRFGFVPRGADASAETYNIGIS